MGENRTRVSHYLHGFRECLKFYAVDAGNVGQDVRGVAANLSDPRTETVGEMDPAMLVGELLN